MQQEYLVEESEKTKKAREKLKKKLDRIDQKITPDALKKKVVEIHRRIARTSPNRVIVMNKSFSLFDENQNAADLSSRLTSIVKQLKNENISYKMTGKLVEKKD